MKQKAFIFDLNRCTGCGACMIACSTEAAFGRDTGVNKDAVVKHVNWRQVYTFNESSHPELPLFHLSMSCNHCADPSCVKGCPASALTKDPETGVVTVNPDHCIGCKYCTWTCPYDAPRFNENSGVVEKCDFCLHRLNEGEAPACVCACPTNALRFGDDETIDEPQRIEGFTDAGLKPSIRFTPLRPQQRIPDMTAKPDIKTDGVRELFESSQKIPMPRIDLKSEWTLLTFTSIAFILVAMFTAALTLPLTLNPIVFIGAGSIGMLLSTAHLGQKTRAYRAILNIKTSWLSREIVLFSMFLSLAGAYMLFFQTQVILGWVTAVIGFLSLFAIDRIYQEAMQLHPYNFHSAHTFFNGLYLAGVLTGNLYISIGAGLVKLVLYLRRKWQFVWWCQSPKLGVSFLRLAFGFVAPAIIVIMYPEFINAISLTGLYGVVTASVIVGELIDRTEFYDELDIITPQKQMLADLEFLTADLNK